jgi:hypothetical protein
VPRLLDREPVPINDSVVRKRRPEYVLQGRVDPWEDKVSEPWQNYLTKVGDTVNAASVRIADPVQLTAQGASVSATDFSGGGLSQGVYRVSYYARITQAATTSSSLTVTFDWTDGGVVPTQSGAAITGNTTTTQQNGTLFIHIDAASPVRYSTTYASVGATSMTYRLDIAIERVGN